MWYNFNFIFIYLVKVVYVDNVNKSIRYDNEVDFNKPDGLREDDGMFDIE